MNKELTQLISKYNDNNKLYINSLYNYMYSNISKLDDLDEIINYFKKIGENNNDHFLISLYNYAKYLSLIKDHNYNDLKYLDNAYNSIIKIEHFERYNLFYGILLSKAIHFNMHLMIEDGVKITSLALKYLNHSNNLDYLAQFNVNLSYIYSELGYLNQAYKVIEKFDYTNPYLNINIKRNLLKCLLFTSYRINNFNKYLTYLDELKKSVRINDDYYETLINAYYLMYYVKINDSFSSKIYFDKIIAYNKDNKKYIESKGPLNRNVILLSLARYYSFIDDYKNAFELYQYMVSNISFFFGQRMEVYDETVRSALKINDNAIALKYYELFSEELKLNREIIYSLLDITNFDIKNNLSDVSDKDYLRIISNMNDLNLFLTDLFSTKSLVDVEKEFKNLCHKFSLTSKIKIIFKLEGNYYIIKNNKLDKIKNYDLQVYDDELIYNIKDELKTKFKEYNYITPIKFEDKIRGYLLFNEDLYLSLDDSTKSLAFDSLNSVGNAIDKFTRIDKIDKKSITDELTGVYNRYALNDAVYSYKIKDNVYFIEFDLDDFKKINDTYGHPAGDYVLKEIANKIAKSFGKHNVFRIGGEEFVALSNKKIEEIEHNLSKLVEDLKNNPFTYLKNKFYVSLSYGGVECASKKSLIEAYNQADKILYDMKNSGKGRGFIERNK